MAKPGKTASHGANSRCPWAPTFSMPPQETWGGGTPRPRKLRLDSVTTADPRYPALGTHQVEGAKGDLGGRIFEAYISRKYRMTWEYGPGKAEITLRNVDNHDECLKKP